MNNKTVLLEEEGTQRKKWYSTSSSELILYMGALDASNKFDAERCLILLTSHDRLDLAVAYGVDNEEDFIGTEMEFGEGFLGKLANEDSARVINNPDSLKKGGNDLEEVICSGSLIFSHILFQNEMLGLVVVCRDSGRPDFTETELDEFIGYVNQFAISLGSQKLVNLRTEELNRTKEKLQMTNAKMKENLQVRKAALAKVKKQKQLIENKKDELARRNDEIVRINTELEEKRLKAERSERKARELIENVNQGIVIVQDGLIKYANPHFIKVTRMDIEELTDSEFISLFDEQAAEKIIMSFREVLRQGEKTRKIYHLTMKRADGEQMNVEIGFSIINYQDDLAFLIYLHDTTERDELQDKLAKAQKLESIGQLAAGIAHEINTPTQFVSDNVRFFEDAFQDIAGLLQSYQSLLEKLEQEGNCCKEVDNIRKQCEEVDIEYLLEDVPAALEQSLDGLRKVAKIVKSMKDFAHSSGGSNTQVDLNKVIATTTTLARNEYKYVSDLELDLTDEIPLVFCDPDKLNQVILNMLVNAAHAIEDVVGDKPGEKGKITISSGHDDKYVIVNISDTGTGIPEEIRSRIFDPFFTTKEVGKGSGQGLAISHKIIVEEYGGEIGIDSEEGSGSTFTIKLPVDNGED
ncbi:MAG: PAS domain S-box protein [Candidatus Latescibacteria bacterium]|nr:PAS domain S-box protein [bacterium]MBD3423155.1 PAS domain S-box protein [Candidatus Latescibacterota bacterium]